MTDCREWRTLVKIDPARPLSETRLAEVCAWPIDAVVVGGSGGYGASEVLSLLTRLRRHGRPLAFEVSDIAALCPGFDLYLVPMVLNSAETEWIIGRHHSAIKRYADLMDWSRVVVEGYCIGNPEAAAARISRARTGLNTEDIVAFALLAEHMLRLPIFYLEYSGAYGSPEVVAAVRRVLGATRLWYGGGIRTPAQVEEMAALADTIVVGNAVYEGEHPFAQGETAPGML
jgi:putative glycerol-1-phosphate prenyltransferase